MRSPSDVSTDVPGAFSAEASLSGGHPGFAGGSLRPDFDICHVGVVLRAVVLVMGVLCIGGLFSATSLLDWLLNTAASMGVALPCLLIWLAVSCRLRARTAALPPRAQIVLAGFLGAACAGFGWAAARHSQFDFLMQQPLLGSLLAGAALGAVLARWLQLREEALRPAFAAARLAQLQARIRPHFLFNTLNTALCLVRVDPVRAEMVLEHLAELFRQALDDGREAVTLAEEIDLARRYLAIEQIRFGERLRLEWSLDPAADAAKLPPLLLQPLVENAVRHGVEPSPEGGTVQIRTSVRLGMAVISVSNSMSVPSKPGHGIALQNVRERLYLMHDVAARFDIDRQAQQFEVRMEVPL